MSRLDELIRELCPDGVRKYSIEELCDISRGRVMSKDYIAENTGEYPVYSSQTENNGELGRINTFDFEGEYLTWTTDGANAGTVFYRSGKFSITNVCGLLRVKREDLITKFLYYTLNSEAPSHVNRGMGNPKLMSNVMARIKVFVPPLEVQQEIVRILDRFTALTAELQKKLSEELQARRQQYEYYRDMLLRQDGVPRMKLADVTTDMYRGTGIKRDEVTENGTPCVRYGEIYTAYNIVFSECKSHTNPAVVPSPKYFEHGDILFAITGESVEDIGKSIAYMGHGKCLAGGDIVVMKHKQEPRYMSYALSTTNAREQKSKGKVKSKVVHASVPSLKDIEIPIPPIEEQTRIADVLDRLASLCNDLSSGLPAEISARQKQYEYYRDKLLTFKEASL